MRSGFSFSCSKVVRFEDLVHRIWKVYPKKFMILFHWICKIKEGLKNITNSWKSEMEFTEIANIQRDCKDAMLMWGYTIYKHSQEMETIESFGKLSI